MFGSLSEIGPRFKGHRSLKLVFFSPKMENIASKNISQPFENRPHVKKSTKL